MKTVLWTTTLLLGIALLWLYVAQPQPSGPPRPGEYWCMVADNTERAADPFRAKRYYPAQVKRVQEGQILYDVGPANTNLQVEVAIFTWMYGRCTKQAFVAQPMVWRE
jgi:hypothetical protein